MSGFLNSLKADLLSRRMLPILALAGVALIGALAYAVIGGGGSSAPSTASVPAPPLTSTKVSGIVVSQAQTDANEPVAETTSGSSHRSSATPRNPFTPLPSTEPQPASTASASTTDTSSSAESSSGSTTAGESESGASSQGPSESSKPKKSSPGKPKTVYHVAVQFGTAPAGTPPQSAQLTPYEDLKRQQPLPDSKQPLVVFRGVIAGGKSATFTLVGEAILRGSGACLPSPSQCLAIDLKPGQTEELEYIPPGAAAVVYQLQVVSITSSKASASAARRAFHGQSKSGLALLRQAGLDALPGLRYSGRNGVLVFAHHPAFAARAHASAWGWPFKG